MTVRKKPEDTRWLAGWRDIDSSDIVALSDTRPERAMHESLSSLTQLGYIVRISGVVGNYSVQCLALKDTPYRLKEPVGLSYCGANLSHVLAAAAYEADLLAVDSSEAQYRIGERARWVQS